MQSNWNSYITKRDAKMVHLENSLAVTYNIKIFPHYKTQQSFSYSFTQVKQKHMLIWILVPNVYNSFIYDSQIQKYSKDPSTIKQKKNCGTAIQWIGTNYMTHVQIQSKKNRYKNCTLWFHSRKGKTTMTLSRDVADRSLRKR